ncbi:MAG: hypothetical protein EXS05_23405 [Planctomycetaceae bacterium]|nr:hypothetical protein [Planctomycetaceae bacterium]
MNVKNGRVPRQQHHKGSGQSRVRINGRDVYLGPWGSERAESEYRRVIAQYLITGQAPLPATDDPRISVNELMLAFLRHAQQHYRKNGKLTDEYHCYTSALRPLKELYGNTPAADFGPMALKAVRNQFVEKRWCRRYVNKSVSRIRHVFKWGVENELIAVTTLHALQAVQGLQAGRTEAPDHPPRQPVPAEHIEAVKKSVRRQRTRDLIDLLLLTGARTGELLSLAGGMLDRTGEVWIAKIRDHKTAHHGKDPVVLFGPKSQLILRQYLVADPDSRLFKMSGDSLRQTIAAACRRLKIPHWSPHWLRHTAATRMRAECGLEVAQTLLGHSKADMTQLYAQKNLDAAIRSAALVG